MEPVSGDRAADPAAGTALVLVAEHAAGRRIAGLDSVDRLVRTAAAAGVRTALVITADDRIRERLRTAGRDADVEVVAPGTDGARRALAAITDAGRPFLFAHTELALDPGYLRRLLESAHDDAVVVAVGHGQGSSHPLTPGLRLAGDRVIELAPDATHHALGVALLPASVAGELAGDGLATATVLRSRLAEWAEAGRLIAFDGGAGLGALIFSDADHRAATRALLRATGKPSDGLVSRNLNRPLSRTVTAALLNTSITPNAVTLVTLALSLVTLWLLARGDHLGFVLGTLLYHVSSIVDGVDGELARLRFQATPSGAWLDTIADQATNLLFVAGVTVGTWQASGGATLPLWIGGFTVLGFIVTPFLVYRRGGRARAEGRLDDFGPSLVNRLETGSWQARLATLATQLVRRDAYALLFFVLAMAGLERSILWILAAGVAGHLLALLVPPRAGS